MVVVASTRRGGVGCVGVSAVVMTSCWEGRPSPLVLFTHDIVPPLPMVAIMRAWPK